MSKSKIKLIVIFFILLTFISCVPSLVYSPSINLPPKPLDKDETQILGGVGYFPETRPDKVPSKMAFGGEATIRHAFAKSFSLQLESWFDFSNNVEDSRWGLSLASIIVFNDSSNYRFGLMPIVAAAFDNNSIEGGGCYIPIALWLNHLDPINFYAAVGPAVGIRDITEENNQWGWGIIMNAGCGILFDNNITLNLEFSFIKQVNEFNSRSDYFLSPSLNIGYIF